MNHDTHHGATEEAEAAEDFQQNEGTGAHDDSDQEYEVEDEEMSGHIETGRAYDDAEATAENDEHDEYEEEEVDEAEDEDVDEEEEVDDGDDMQFSNTENLGYVIPEGLEVIVDDSGQDQDQDDTYDAADDANANTEEQDIVELVDSDHGQDFVRHGDQSIEASRSPSLGLNIHHDGVSDEVLVSKVPDEELIGHGSRVSSPPPNVPLLLSVSTSPSPTPSSALERPASVSTQAAAASFSQAKATATATAIAPAPHTTQLSVDEACLQSPGAWLNGNIMTSFTQFAAAHCPTWMVLPSDCFPFTGKTAESRPIRRLIQALSSDNKMTHRPGKIGFPYLYENSHWAFVLVNLASRQICIADSMPDYGAAPSAIKQAVTLLDFLAHRQLITSGVNVRPECRSLPCPRQINTHSCGVLCIVAALRAAVADAQGQDLEVPDQHRSPQPQEDTQEDSREEEALVWRGILLALTGQYGRALRNCLPTELLDQPVLDVEPRLGEYDGDGRPSDNNNTDAPEDSATRVLNSLFSRILQIKAEAHVFGQKSALIRPVLRCLQDATATFQAMRTCRDAQLKQLQRDVRAIEHEAARYADIISELDRMEFSGGRGAGDGLLEQLRQRMQSLEPLRRRKSDTLTALSWRWALIDNIMGLEQVVEELETLVQTCDRTEESILGAIREQSHLLSQ